MDSLRLSTSFFLAHFQAFLLFVCISTQAVSDTQSSLQTIEMETLYQQLLNNFSCTCYDAIKYSDVIINMHRMASAKCICTATCLYQLWGPTFCEDLNQEIEHDLGMNTVYTISFWHVDVTQEIFK